MMSKRNINVVTKKKERKINDALILGIADIVDDIRG
jgi:hypothetical protein